MKTTLDLPDDLMRTVRIRALDEGRRLQDVVADCIRRGLDQGLEPSGGARPCVRLPLVACAHAAGPGEEMTPERVAAILLDQETEGSRG